MMWKDIQVECGDDAAANLRNGWSSVTRLMAMLPDKDVDMGAKIGAINRRGVESAGGIYVSRDELLSFARAIVQAEGLWVYMFDDPNESKTWVIIAPDQDEAYARLERRYTEDGYDHEHMENVSVVATVPFHFDDILLEVTL